MADACSGRGALSFEVHLAAAMMLDSRRVDPSGRTGRHELCATGQHKNSRLGRRVDFGREEAIVQLIGKNQSAV